MSINAMQWALKQPLNGCQKFVLFMLAYHANEACQCWPGLETIAKECGITRATTIVHVNSLTKHGLISKQHRSDARGYRRSTLYTLHLDMDLINQSKEFQRREILHKNNENQSQNIHSSNVQNLDGNIIESSLEQTIEQTLDIGAELSLKSPGIKQSNILIVFQYWQTVMNKPNAKLDEKRRRTIARALGDRFTLEQLKQAIDGCAKTPFNMGENENRQPYNDIELILRNASYIERFISNSSNPPSATVKANSVQQNIMAGVGYE